MTGRYHTDAQQHTLSPIVTGATCIGVKYNGGVLVAADTLVSYGGNARYKDTNRLKKVGNFTLLGCSGEYSDFQYIGNLLDELDNDDFMHEDGCMMGPHEYSSYIGRVMYNRRTKMNPLFNQFIVAGKKKDEPTKLAFVDHQGTFYEEDFLATGFGTHLAKPILRNEWKENMTKEEAQDLIVKCLQVCFYRDCRAYNKIRIGCCDGNTVTISEPAAMDHFWGHSLWLEKRLQGSKTISDSW